MGVELLPQFILENYEVHEWKHSCAILKADFPNEWNDLIALLRNFKLCKSWITEGGRRKSKVSEEIDSFYIIKDGKKKSLILQLRLMKTY